MKISRNLQIIIFLIILIIITSIVWPQNPINSGIKNIGGFIVNPAKSFLGKTIRKTSNVFKTVKDIRKLAQINQMLEIDNRKLIVENSRLKEVENENKILRSQLAFSQDRPAFNLTAAQVIGRDPSNFLQYMTIDKGENNGLRKNMMVISQGYLVGKISEINKTSAKVFLITNPSSIVNAMVQESRATGIVKGALGYDLTIEAISQDAKVKTGDLVITSGLGGTYPKGLIIGKIEQVEEKQSAVFKKARITPLIDFTSLEVIFVITN
jgi:rod shape-determining protein MreC